jgi:hypothetical protein
VDDRLWPMPYSITGTTCRRASAPGRREPGWPLRPVRAEVRGQAPKRSERGRVDANLCGIGGRTYIRHDGGSASNVSWLLR